MIEIVDDGAPDASDWVFIYGLGRTGSTALCRLLFAHDDVRVHSEAYLWGYVELLRREFIELSYKSIANCNAVVDYPGDLEQKKLTWRTSQLRDFFEGYRKATGGGVLLFGDKKAVYGEVLDDLVQVFPGCKLVDTIRDFWDRVGSLYRVHWAFPEEKKTKSGIEVARLCYDLTVDQMNKRQDASKYNPHIVSFHDMAGSLRPTVASLLDYLELDHNRMDWGVLDRMSHADTSSSWQSIPEVVELVESGLEPPDGG